MPVEYTKVTGENQIVGLWSLESLEKAKKGLSATARKGYELSHSEACRQLIKEMTGWENTEIVKDMNGKPSIKNSKSHISFSHSGNYAAAIYNNEHSVGIDIQQAKSKILRLSNKFCNQEELDFITPKDKLSMLHIIWGAKEAMFKQYGLGAVLFKEHILVHPFTLKEAGEIMVTFRKNEPLTYKFHYECNEDYFLVYSASYL